MTIGRMSYQNKLIIIETNPHLINPLLVDIIQ